ncbi:acetate/propionate family kinase [Buchnera aphidicola (Ceratovacuna keduensis)]|uniref:acetate/propionate family kinase n=1 Tax=Buchnera aphidicola TaxID=9 RepID=UPI0031B86E18
MKDLVLVLNFGSSSIKFSIIDPIKEVVYLNGEASSLNLHSSLIKWFIKKKKYSFSNKKFMSHNYAVNYICKKILLKYNYEMFSKVVGIGHRVVNGGILFKKSVLINKNVIKNIEKCFYLAPIHNPLNLLGIKTFIDIFPKLNNKNVAVFDTSFHNNLPKISYLYAIPTKFYDKYHIRKYGAHGINCSYILNKVSIIFNRSIKKLNIIICHLGNGSSVSVVKNGVCIDTSMGFTPLSGLIMGTRSGDIDPSIIFYMYENLNISIKKIKNILNNKSGILGLNGKSSDFRYSENRYNTSLIDKISIEMFCYRLAKYISSYFFLIKNKIDAIIFTGGIGTNSKLVRKITINHLNSLNFYIDEKKNNKICKDFNFINKYNTIPILVISANEEIVIAKDTINTIN